ncbi:MAG: hypothetical protein ACLSG4_10710 [Anaerobutyricum sp.]
MAWVYRCLHHNKSKTNYHIHLIFSGKAAVNLWCHKKYVYDENGKHVRTKEILDEAGQLRQRLIIPKGGYIAYSFYYQGQQVKNDRFLDEVKRSTLTLSIFM